MPQPPADRTVCDGCWKRGVCQRADTCRCPCTRDGWQHGDAPK